jgi:hypothetical protein
MSGGNPPRLGKSIEIGLDRVFQIAVSRPGIGNKEEVRLQAKSPLKITTVALRKTNP